MKKTRLLAILFALVMVLALVSCGGPKNPIETEPPRPTYARELFANWQEYTIVYEDGATEVVSNAFVQFNLKLSEKYNTTIRANSDFLIPGQTVPEGTLEILVGLTNRPESIQTYENLKANDYFIGMINNRMVIVGGSDKATAAALEHFMNYLMEADGLYYPTDGYTYEADYVVDKLTVGGIDVSEFVLVYGSEMSEGDRNLVSYLCETVANVCGVKLETALSSEEEQTYEILVGDTGRALTSKELADETYAIEQTDTKLALYANGDNSDSFVLKYLIVDILSAIPEGESYDIKLENVFGEPLVWPALISSNLPETFSDLRGKYDYDVLSAETTLDRFFETMDELPDEVTVLDPILLENYPLSLAKKQVYVSGANGDDSNPGTKAAPYKTIAKGLSAMKGQGGGVLWIEGGDYALTETVLINDVHGGTAITPLFIKSYGEEDVTLTSNVIVKSEGFKLVDTATDSVAARLPDKAKDKVYYVNLYDLGWKESDIVDISTDLGPARVYVDGEELTLAQYPNAYYEDGKTQINPKDLLYFKYVYETGSVTLNTSELYEPWVARVNADPNLTLKSIIPWEIRVLNERDGFADKGDGAMGDEILSWVNTGDIWYYGNIHSGYEHGYYTIDPNCVHGEGLLGTAKEDGYYSLKSVQPNRRGCMASTNSQAGRNTFFLFNAIEALDAPGEWFIDKETGNFYIYPKTDDITEQLVMYSGSNSFDLVKLDGAANVVLDGIGADGSSETAITVNECDSIVIQYATIRNTTGTSVLFNNSRNSALIYSDLSRSYDMLVGTSNNQAIYDLVPMNIFIQNNIFSDTPPSVSEAIVMGGCRAIVSHNYFIDCVLKGTNAVECIIEYNRFEGGNRFITDGGMAYLGGANIRGNHIRNNLFHMFNATHCAVYFDTMGSGNYAYYNTISTLGGKSDFHKAWYSSTGHGNVCFGNIIVLRNSAQIAAVEGGDIVDEDSGVVVKGDEVNQAQNFYYYYGKTHKDNSGAASMWTSIKEQEVNARLVNSDQEAWNARYPEYMNFVQGTKAILEAYEDDAYKVYYKPQALSEKTLVFKTADDTVIWVPPYEYLDENNIKKTKEAQTLKAENGEIVLTFDDIAAMERLRRQAAFSVIKNNIILGGSTIKSNVITNTGGDKYKGLLKDVTMEEDNYLEFYYDKILADADNYDYTISDETWAMLESKMGAEFVSILKNIDYEETGLTD